MKKRILTFILVALLCLGMLPASAFAGSSFSEEGDAAADLSIPSAGAEDGIEADVSRMDALAGSGIPEAGDGIYADVSRMEDPALPEDDGARELVVEVLAKQDEEPEPVFRENLSGAEPKGITGFGGSGTKEDPWQAASAEDLVRLAGIVNSGESCAGKYFKLTGNVDLSDVCGESLSWTPIGYAGDITFNGVFDGGDHTVSGLYIEGEDSYVGLFGCVTGTVKNLNVSGSVTGKNYVGGIAGCSYGTLEECSFTGKIDGKSYVGGIAGCSGKDGLVLACESSATVNGFGTGIGGVVGWANNIAWQGSRSEALSDGASNATGGGRVENCVFTGTLTGRSPLGLGTASSSDGKITITITDNAFGGIVGWNNGCAVSGCTNRGTVNGDDFAGGIVGDSNNGGVVADCFNYGAVTGASMLNGGIAGRIAEGSVTGCTNAGDVTGGDFTGGVVGAIDKSSSISGCANAEGCTVTGGKFVGGAVGIANCMVTDCTNAGAVVGNNGVGGVVGWTTRDVRNCGSEGSASVTGTGADGRTGGVVGNAYGAVENCSNKGSVGGTSHTGGVAGYTSATVRNCHNNGTVTGSDVSTGGVAGSANSTCVVSDCTNDGPVTGSQATGGVAGTAYCLVSNCKNLAHATVTGKEGGTGGVVGYMNEKGRAESLKNEGAVVGGDYTGGVIGIAQVAVNGAVNSGSVTGAGEVGGVAGVAASCSGCQNSGAVVGTGRVGGVIGYCEGAVSDCVSSGSVSGDTLIGGIIGTTDGTVTGCVNTGKVSATDSLAGGVAGYAGKGAAVSGCRNESEVSGNTYTGGVVGYQSADGSISDCNNAASGIVTGNGSGTGGVVGAACSSVSHCTNAGKVTGQANTGGVVGTATADSTIDNCQNMSGAVVTGKSGTGTGGVVGASAGTVEECPNAGTVNGQNGVGGVVGGIMQSSVVRFCHNKGTVTGGEATGGVIGQLGEQVDGAISESCAEQCTNSGTVNGGQSSGGVVGINNGTLRKGENTAALTGRGAITGGVVGLNAKLAVVTGCRNWGKITAGGDYTGGVLGYNEGTAEDCRNEGEVNGNGHSLNAGIAGSNAGTLTDCRNTAKVYGGTTHAGGIAGSTHATLTGCSNTAEVSNTTGTCGGITGEADGTVSGCSNSGSVSTKTTGEVYVGGIVGRCRAVVQNCNNTGNVTGGEGIGGVAGLVGGNNNAKVVDCTNGGKINGNAGYAGGIVGSLDSNCRITGCTNEETGTVSGGTKTDVGGIVGTAGNNITISGCVNRASVTGTKNDVGGVAGYVAKNLTITGCVNHGSVQGYNNVGGIVGQNGSGGTISKCTNKGAVTGNYETAGIIGSATCVITDCVNTGRITGNGIAGKISHATAGIVAVMSGSNTSVTNCRNDGPISGEYNIGGVVGFSSGCPITNCENNAAVSSRITEIAEVYLGGVCGYLQNTTISSCVNTDTVVINAGYSSHVGGVVGSSEGSKLELCRNYTTISAYSKVGGIAGSLTNGSSIWNCINSGNVNSINMSSGGDCNCGGILGFAGQGTQIIQCVNTFGCKISASGRVVGGIVGLLKQDGKISRCYNKGEIEGQNCVGGLVGYAGERTTMEHCFSYITNAQITCRDKTKRYRGSLVALEISGSPMTMIYNYYLDSTGLYPLGRNIDTSTKGQFDDLGESSFKNQNNFETWDFDRIWAMGSQTPYLRMEGAVPTLDTINPDTSPETPPAQIDIYSAGDLASLREKVSNGLDFSHTTVYLRADIDMGYDNWTPIGPESLPFNGVFDGLGHTIYNLYVESGEYCAGLFGSNAGTIRNLAVRGSVTGTNPTYCYTGGIAGVNRGVIESCAFYGDVTSSSSSPYSTIGGIAGYVIFDGKVYNCYHEGDVTGGIFVGGIAGKIGDMSVNSYGTVQKSIHFSGEVSGGSEYTGAVTGYAYGSVRSCFALSGTAGSIAGTGEYSNCSLSSEQNFKNGTMMGSLGNMWLRGAEHPEILALCYSVQLWPNTGASGEKGVPYGVRYLGGTLPPCPFTNGDAIFLGWNTEQNGSGTAYEDCGTIKEDANLYAQWITGIRYLMFTADSGALFDGVTSTVWASGSMEPGETNTVYFTSRQEIRPCAIIFQNDGNRDCPLPPGWRLEAKTRPDDAAWTVLAESDGAPFSRKGTEKYAEIKNVDDRYFSFFRLIWQGPSMSLRLANACFLLRDGADMRFPVTLHKNDGTPQVTRPMYDNGSLAALENNFSVNGKYFLGWNTAADGSGTFYANLAPYVVKGHADFYAQWLGATAYRSYIAVKAYDEATPLSDGEPQNDPAYKGSYGATYNELFDKSETTGWNVKPRGGATWSLEFDAREYIKPVGYAFTIAEGRGYNPKSWKLEGRSKDGAWVLLDEVLDGTILPELSSKTTTLYFKIGNTEEYCSFRVSFHGLAGTDTFQLNELYLLTDGTTRMPAVSFDPHGGSGTMAKLEIASRNVRQLPANSYVREGYDFAGWNTAPDGSGKAYADKEGYRILGDATLYAQWTPKRFKVSFLGENGETLYEDSLSAGQLPVYKGEAPVKAGTAGTAFLFDGWNPDIIPVKEDAAYSVRFRSVQHHDHDFIYSAEGATITASCGAESCTLADGKVTLTLAAPSLNTYGGTGTAAASLTGLNQFNAETGKTVAAADITYEGRDGTAYSEPSKAPTGAGKYTAKITVEGKTASLDYEIAKADPTANAPADVTATYGDTLNDVALTNPEGNTPGTWAWADGSAGVGDAGCTVTFKASFTPADTANYKTLSDVDVNVTVNKADSVPAAVTANNRTYDGTEKPLVTVDDSMLSGGTMWYALGTATEATEAFKSFVPEKTNAGTYYVWYKVLADDNNHKDTAEAMTEVTVARMDAGDLTVVLKDPEQGAGRYTYTGDPIDPVEAVKNGSATLDKGEYSIAYQKKDEEGNWTDVAPEDVREAGSYRVVITPEQENYEGVTEASFSIDLDNLPRIVGHSLLLTGSIGVRFYVEIPDETIVNLDSCQMTFRLYKEDGEQTVTFGESEKVTVDGKELYVYTCYVNSVQLADRITAKLEFMERSADGQSFEKADPVTEEYSARQYILEFREKQDQFDAKTRKLVRALADYSHYAQIYLSKERGWTLGSEEENPDHVAMEDYGYKTTKYTKAEIEEAKKGVSDKEISVMKSSNIAKVSYSLLLASDTSICLYFTPVSSYKGEATATLDGMDVAVSKTGGRFKVVIPGIPAPKLGNMHTVRLMTGKKVTTVRVSALSYANALLESSTNETLINAMTALYRYYEAAEAVFIG